MTRETPLSNAVINKRLNALVEAEQDKTCEFDGCGAPAEICDLDALPNAPAFFCAAHTPEPRS